MNIFLLQVSDSTTINSHISLFETNTLLTHIIAGIIGAIICIILTGIYNKFIAHRLDKFFNYWWPKTFRRKISLKGEWKQSIHIDSPNYEPVSTSNVCLKHRGNNITGTFTIKNKKGENLSYFITGKIINKNYLEGEWYNILDGHNYQGNFLLAIEINMNSMVGTWTGTTRNNEVKSGQWVWHRNNSC